MRALRQPGTLGERVGCRLCKTAPRATPAHSSGADRDLVCKL